MEVVEEGVAGEEGGVLSPVALSPCPSLSHLLIVPWHPVKFYLPRVHAAQAL